MKKYIFHGLWLLIAATAFQACRYDSLILFDQKPDVYFSWLDGNRRELDSTLIKFESKIGDMISIDIPVTITGALSETERQVSFTVDTGTTAIAGTHYELPEHITIPARQPGGTLTIHFFRTPDINANREVLKLAIKLTNNEQFGTNYREKLVNTTTGEKRQVLVYKMYISDFIQQPMWWAMSGTNSTAFGEYSDKKFLTVANANGFPPDWLNGEIEWNGLVLGNLYTSTGANNFPRYMNPLAKRTTQWLNWYKETNGEPYLEDDGSEMKMGPNGQL